MSDLHARALRPRWQARASSIWSRWLALLVLVFAVPASEQVVRELTCMVVERAESCADDCEGSGDCSDGGGCAGACAHCACCHPPSAFAAAAVAWLRAASRHEPQRAEPREVHPSGYSPPPFRPPMA